MLANWYTIASEKGSAMVIIRIQNPDGSRYFIRRRGNLHTQIRKGMAWAKKVSEVTHG